MKVVNDNLFANPLRQDDLFDHFFGMDVVAMWTDTSSDTGAAPTLVVDGTASAISITTGATQNNEAYFSSKAHFDVVNSRPLVFEGRLQYAEAETNAAAVAFGLMSGWGANHLVDTTGALVASFSGFVFHKLAATTKWRVTSSVGTTRYGNNETTLTAGGAGYASFRIEVRPISSTEAEVVFLVDTAGGTNFSQVRDSTTNLPIKHIVTYTSFAPAAAGIGVKATGATGTETVVLDSVRVSQVK